CKVQGRLGEGAPVRIVVPRARLRGSGWRKGLLEQHHRDAVADREPLAALGADEVLALLAHRRVVLVGAGQDLEELAVDRHVLIFGLDGHVNIRLTWWPTPTAGVATGSQRWSGARRR